MKKKLLIAATILTLAIIASLGINFNIGKTTTTISIKNVEALARGEGPGDVKYNKIKGDCTKNFSIDASGYVTIRGKKIKVGGAGGTYSAHYTDVQIGCPIGSMYVTCSECSCSAFWDNKC